MKFLYSILLCFLTWNIGITCTISGPSSLTLNGVGTYSISSNLGHCSNCYKWTVSSNGQIVSSSSTSHVVSIKRIGSGNITLSVIYFNGVSCVTCTPKTILPNTGCTTNYSVSISNTAFEGLGAIALFCTVTPFISSGATYSWNVTYSRGPNYSAVTTTSHVAVPLSGNRSITQASVTVNYQGCVFSDNHVFTPPITLSDMDLNGDMPLVSLEVQDVEVNPNPTTGELNVIGLPLEGHTISILDLEGKEIISNAPLDQGLNISDQVGGIYHYQISNANEIVKSGMLIKE